MSLLRIMRTIRLFRLIKLLRMLRASRIFSRWQNYIGVSYAQMGIAKLLAVATWTMHLMACIWAWQGASGWSVCLKARANTLCSNLESFPYWSWWKPSLWVDGALSGSPCTLYNTNTMEALASVAWCS